MNFLFTKKVNIFNLFLRILIFLFFLSRNRAWIFSIFFWNILGNIINFFLFLKSFQIILFIFDFFYFYIKQCIDWFVIWQINVDIMIKYLIDKVGCFLFIKNTIAPGRSSFVIIFIDMSFFDKFISGHKREWFFGKFADKIVRILQIT